MKLMADNGPTDTGFLDFSLFFGALSTGDRCVALNDVH
jgi:hypothetical protein